MPKATFIIAHAATSRGVIGGQSATLPPGSSIRFAAISLYEAQARYLAREDALATLELAIAQKRAAVLADDERGGALAQQALECAAAGMCLNSTIGVLNSSKRTARHSRARSALTSGVPSSTCRCRHEESARTGAPL